MFGIQTGAVSLTHVSWERTMGSGQDPWKTLQAHSRRAAFGVPSLTLTRAHHPTLGGVAGGQLLQTAASGAHRTLPSPIFGPLSPQRQPPAYNSCYLFPEWTLVTRHISKKPVSYWCPRKAAPWVIRRERQRWDLADGNTAMDGLRWLFFKTKTKNVHNRRKHMSRKGREGREGEKAGGREERKERRAKRGKKKNRLPSGFCHFSTSASGHCGLAAGRARDS